jgi:hypothetical protein
VDDDDDGLGVQSSLGCGETEEEFGEFDEEQDLVAGLKVSLSKRFHARTDERRTLGMSLVPRHIVVIHPLRSQTRSLWVDQLRLHRPRPVSSLCPSQTLRVVTSRHTFVQCSWRRRQEATSKRPRNGSNWNESRKVYLTSECILTINNGRADEIRLSEANIESILAEMEALYRDHSRNGAFFVVKRVSGLP